MKTFSVEEITLLVGGELIGNCKDQIFAPEQIENAEKGNVTFIGNSKYARLWENSNASIAIVYEGIRTLPEDGKAFVKVKNPDLAMAMLLDAFEPEPPYFETDIHPTAVIDETVILGNGSKIGANAYIGKNVTIGENVIIYPNVAIFDDSTIGNETVIWSGSVIRERSKIGSHCIFHTNVSIGADGFGYRPSSDGRGLVKIKHIGNVVIGNGVEVGANSCIDRGKFSSTILGDGCKIDNLVQIGHNSVLGKCCIMAGNSGLAGSVTLGDGVIIGGSASIKDHVTIHSGAKVGAGSGVISDVAAGKTVLGYPACDSREKMKQWVALRKLARN
jgi:UDP-3-O-[3-hydroxymyristoyl] glucosamine N-acyltransferase